MSDFKNLLLSNTEPQHANVCTKFLERVAELAPFRMFQNRAVAEIRMRPLHVPYPFNGFLSLTAIQQPNHPVSPAPTIFPNHFTNDQWNRCYMYFYRQMMLAQISADVHVGHCCNNY